MVRLRKNDCVEALLRGGIDVSIQSWKNESAIQTAVTCVNIEALVLMLRYRNIDVNELVYKGGNLLDATLCKLGHMNRRCKDIYKLLIVLLGRGINTTVIDSFPRREQHLLVYKDSWTIMRIPSEFDFGERMCEFSLPLELLLLKFQFENPKPIENIVFWADGEEELKRLNNILIIIYPRMTLYDMLFMKTRKMINYCYNKELVKLYQKCGEDFENRFRIYGFLLNAKLRRATRRRKSIDLACYNLESALAQRLPTHCSQKIFKYLSDIQLKMFNGDEFSRPTEVMYYNNSTLNHEREIWFSRNAIHFSMFELNDHSSTDQESRDQSKTL